MVLFNYSTRELTAKIVYYGPGLCGKTTNLQFIFDNLPTTVKGKMLSLATKTDRTLFFDFLPLDLGEIRGMKTRIQLYTVPGQVFYNETRRLVLKGADGVVFVADSQKQMIDANIDSYRNLEENLRVHSMKLQEMPLVIQYNKRDLPNLATIEELNAAINHFNSPYYESVAPSGIGVQDSLKAITKLVLLNLTKRYDTKKLSAETVGSSVAAAAAAGGAATSGVGAAEGTGGDESSIESTVRIGTSARSGFDEAVDAQEEVVELTEEYEEPEAVAVSAEEDADPIELVDEIEEPIAASSIEQELEIEELAEEDILEVDEAEEIAASAPTSPAARGAMRGPAGSTAAPARAARPPSGPPTTGSSLAKEAGAPPFGSQQTFQIPRIVPGEERQITLPVDIDMNGTLSRFDLTITVRLSKPSRE